MSTETPCSTTTSPREGEPLRCQGQLYFPSAVLGANNLDYGSSSFFFLSRILLFWSTQITLSVAPYSTVLRGPCSDSSSSCHDFCTIYHIFSMMQCCRPNSFSHCVCTFSEFSAHSGVGFFQFLLHFFEKCSSLVFLLSFFSEFL